MSLSACVFEVVYMRLRVYDREEVVHIHLT